VNVSLFSLSIRHDLSEQDTHLHNFIKSLHDYIPCSHWQYARTCHHLVTISSRSHYQRPPLHSHELTCFYLCHAWAVSQELNPLYVSMQGPCRLLGELCLLSVSWNCLATTSLVGCLSSTRQTCVPLPSRAGCVLAFHVGAWQPCCFP
jgi:hypothetical protein